MTSKESAQRVASAFNPLVSIQAGSSVPFFCVHGAGGNVLNFRDIARRLGERQTFYGLQAKGVDGAVPLGTIEEMASLYLPELLRVHRKGPFMLGGYSGGGNVAYEMAQRLRRQGRAVSLVVLLDTFRAGIKPIRLDSGGHVKKLLDEGPTYLLHRAQARAKRFKWELEVNLMHRFYASQGKPLPHDLRELEMTRAFWAAADSYRPEPYAGKVNLYRASRVEPNMEHAGATLGWSELVSDLEVVEVPGDHDSLVYEPNVTVMTEHLKRSLAAAASDRSS